MSTEVTPEVEAAASNGTKPATLGDVTTAPAKATPSKGSAQVEVPRIDAVRLVIPIVGTSPLILHKFSEKARRQMLDNMQGRKQPKQPRDPQADYREAFYRHDRTDDDGYTPTEGDPDPEAGQPGMPVIAFKASTVSAARLFDKSVTMTMLRQCLFFRGEMSQVEQMQLVRIFGTPQMREDVVRVGNGGTDLRYRPMFPTWTTELHVTFVKSMLTKESVLSLIEAGGLGVGVGEWRPERNGDFGTFQIDESREIRVIE